MSPVIPRADPATFAVSYAYPAALASACASETTFATLPSDEPAMFPVSYAYPATSSSPAVFASATVPATPSPSSARVTFEASTIIAVLSCLVFVLWTVAIFLFAPSLRQQYLAYRAQKKHAKKAKKRIQGLGFGYDGLSEAEFEELARREEEAGQRSFVRLPPYPPSLSAIALLPPITIPTRREGLDMVRTQERGEAESGFDTDADPAPIYERGNFDWQVSKSEEDVKSEGEPVAKM